MYISFVVDVLLVWILTFLGGVVFWDILHAVSGDGFGVYLHVHCRPDTPGSLVCSHFGLNPSVAWNRWASKSARSMYLLWGL